MALTVVIRRAGVIAVSIAVCAALAGVVALPAAALADEPWLRVSGLILMVLAALFGFTSGGYVDRANSVDRHTVILTGGAFWRRGSLWAGDFTELGVWLFIGVPLFVLGGLAYTAA